MHGFVKPAVPLDEDAQSQCLSWEWEELAKRLLTMWYAVQICAMYRRFYTQPHSWVAGTFVRKFDLPALSQGNIAPSLCSDLPRDQRMVGEMPWWQIGRALLNRDCLCLWWCESVEPRQLAATLRVLHRFTVARLAWELLIASSYVRYQRINSLS